MTPENMKTRNLALVLLDIVGSTAFVQKVGAVTAARILQHHDRLARSTCYKNRGREIDRSDGFLMSFESVADAVQFALDYNRDVTSRIKLRSRIGIHWGSIVEVTQYEVYVDAGAKRVELEGVAKNIAARTMSIAMPSQILLTADAYSVLRSTVRLQLPSNVRTACVGVYKFKGIGEPVTVYAISEVHDLLQPPPGNEKAVRLGGPKYIKKLARDRKLKDYLHIAYKYVMVFGTLFALFISYHVLRSAQLLSLLGIYNDVYWLHRAAQALASALERIFG